MGGCRLLYFVRNKKCRYIYMQESCKFFARISLYTRSMFAAILNVSDFCMYLCTYTLSVIIPDSAVCISTRSGVSTGYNAN